MSNSTVRLRDYRKEDIPYILRLIKTAFSEQRGIVDPPSSAERKTIEIVENELTKASALVAEIDGELAACVFYQEIQGEIYIDRLSVLPGFRKRGLGTILMEEVRRRAAESDIKRLSLSVRIELENQLNYYRKMGYEVTSCESHEGYLKPTYFVMKKSI